MAQYCETRVVTGRISSSTGDVRQQPALPIGLRDVRTNRLALGARPLRLTAQWSSAGVLHDPLDHVELPAQRTGTHCGERCGSCFEDHRPNVRQHRQRRRQEAEHRLVACSVVAVQPEVAERTTVADVDLEHMLERQAAQDLLDRVAAVALVREQAVQVQHDSAVRPLRDLAEEGSVVELVRTRPEIAHGALDEKRYVDPLLVLANVLDRCVDGVPCLARRERDVGIEEDVVGHRPIERQVLARMLDVQPLDTNEQNGSCTGDPARCVRRPGRRPRGREGGGRSDVAMA